MLRKSDLSITKLRECIHNDTKDDVQSNCGDENKERDVDNRQFYDVSVIIVHHALKCLQRKSMHLRMGHITYRFMIEKQCLIQIRRVRLSFLLWYLKNVSKYYVFSSTLKHKNILQNANGSLTLGRLYFQITWNKCNEAPLVGAGLQKRDVSRRQNTDINHNAMDL